MDTPGSTIAEDIEFMTREAACRTSGGETEEERGAGKRLCFVALPARALTIFDGRIRWIYLPESDGSSEVVL